MTNSLPPDLAAFVQASVAAGTYDSPEAVVVAGVRLLQERQQKYDEYVRREVQKGLDELERGEYIELKNDEEIDAFFEDIRRRGLERLQAESRSADV
jgi:antitoxin ParD1/3/4